MEGPPSPAAASSSRSIPISEAQRQDLQQRLVDNFSALLHHREVSSQQLHLGCGNRHNTLSWMPSCLLWPAAADMPVAVCCCRQTQGYRPSHVPDELIEQIAAVVEAKAFLHVVSSFLATHSLCHAVATAPPPGGGAASQRQLQCISWPWSCSHPLLFACVCLHTPGACSRAGHEQPADGADVRQGGCNAAAVRGRTLHTPAGGARRRMLPQRQQRRHAAAAVTQ